MLLQRSDTEEYLSNTEDRIQEEAKLTNKAPDRFSFF